MSDERLYTDEEVAEILSRAVNPSASSTSVVRRPEGVTLGDIEAIATEAGIDPARVRSAALTLGDPSVDEGIRILGPRPKHVFEGEIEGTVSPERYGEAVAAIRRRYPGRGKAEVVGDWLEWTSDASLAHVTVRSEGANTRVHFAADTSLYALGVYVPTAFVAFLTMVTSADEGALTLGLVALVAGTAYSIARGVWEVLGRKLADRNRRIFNEITADISRLAAPRLAPDATNVRDDGGYGPSNRPSRDAPPDETSRP